jgi:glycosyltransferase involved in cell wall biosynthesis
MLPSVSVIIPVYNDVGGIATCLGALREQTYPRERVEIIVVDNGSNPNLATVAREFPEVRIEREEMPGSYAARNKGLLVARGEIIAFTDADCIPQPQWIENGVASLLGVENCGLVGGAVEFTFESEKQRSVYELYDSMFYFNQMDYVTRGRFACTANAFTRASVVREVGGFDQRLRSIGDREWGNRIAAAGYQHAYARDSVVLHPARSTLKAHLKKRLRLAGGHHDVTQRKRLRFLRLVNALRRHLVRDPLVVAGALLKEARRIGLSPAAKIMGVYTFLSWAEAYERLRLQAGGRSRR